MGKGTCSKARLVYAHMHTCIHGTHMPYTHTYTCKEETSSFKLSLLPHIQVFPHHQKAKILNKKPKLIMEMVKSKLQPGMILCPPLTPALRKQTGGSLCAQDHLGLHELQDSQGYIVKPCLKKTNKTKTKCVPSGISLLTYNTLLSQKPLVNPPAAALAPSGSHVHNLSNSLVRCSHSMCLI